MTTEASTEAPMPVSKESGGQPIVVESTDLFRGAREVVIRHNQLRYVLRVTRQGKLILNK